MAAPISPPIRRRQDAITSGELAGGLGEGGIRVGACQMNAG
jgi:hypothetical protein